MVIPRPISFQLVVVLSFVAPLAAGATNIKVTTTADDVAVNGNCTLREAVIAANTDAVVDACPAGSTNDLILLRAGRYGLSLLGNGEDASMSGDLDVHGVVSVRGAGASSTIIDAESGADILLRDRVIHVSEFGVLTLSGLTISGGLCGTGAGIFNAGEVHLLGSRVEGNYTREDTDFCRWLVDGGAGIFNASSGWLTLTKSTVSQNLALGIGGRFDFSSTSGGGLTNLGLATIADSRFLHNGAGAAGGILNVGGLEVSGTEFIGNYSRSWAAALWNREDATITRSTISGSGGLSAVENGIGTIVALLQMRNTTVSGNVSYARAGSIHNQAGNVYVTNSTIAGNFADMTAGIGGPGRTELTDSIVFNPDAGGPNGDCQFPVLSTGYNIDGDGSCNVAGSGINPLLGPLADNGGPTATHALLPGSPAIDQVPVSHCADRVDQRGVGRPGAPRPWGCDVGAYEFSTLGDIELIVRDVQQLALPALLDQLSLLDALMRATRAEARDDAVRACAALGDFASLVSSYAAAGRLPPTSASELLADTDRVRGLICP